MMAENPYAKCKSCGGRTIDRCCVASRTVEVVMGDLVIAWDEGYEAAEVATQRAKYVHKSALGERVVEWTDSPVERGGE